ncbi:hypothetical protein Bca52824_066870 [Brassica carinata]|uniref:Myb/SANT-like DNA-binding domain-containing protein n=1 Tax=Brassica carinata TaxID=52824 RepID=A0A8X7QL12_BRACI|nr:hypothetical protein Bca52824_066870 [Brassica carinata]
MDTTPETQSKSQSQSGGGGGSHRLPPGREDWWSEDATATLIEAWGDRYVHLSRGNLRQNDWKEVADAVNSRHGNGRPKTDVQCKNRIDTLKKKYKILVLLREARFPNRPLEDEDLCPDPREGSSCRELARAILKLGEVYERIESAKQGMMIELEKQRMEAAKEIELQRMNMLMDMQMELEKSKLGKRRAAASGKKL